MTATVTETWAATRPEGYGQTLRVALRTARRLGLSISRKGGEVVVSRPGDRPVVFHATKNAPRKLVRYLRKIEQEQNLDVGICTDDNDKEHSQ